MIKIIIRQYNNKIYTVCIHMCVDIKILNNGSKYKVSMNAICIMD